MSKVVKKLSCYDAVIIVDIGYFQHSRHEMEVLFPFLDDGYERGSLMITINLPFSKWEQIFKDPRMPQLLLIGWHITVRFRSSTLKGTGWEWPRKIRAKNLMAGKRALSEWILSKANL